MPLCHFVVLDHCPSELSLDCAPLFLLLNIHRGPSITDVKIFALSNFQELLRGMPRQKRDWIVGMISDFQCNLCGIGRPDEHNLAQFRSLGVGPLRTAFTGSIDIDYKENIIKAIRTYIQEANPEGHQKQKISSLAQFTEIADGFMNE